MINPLIIFVTYILIVFVFTNKTIFFIRATTVINIIFTTFMSCLILQVSILIL